jgi:hypothetical protein
MATEAQFDVFAKAYEEENERYSQLESRAKFNLTIVTFYLGAIAFKFPDVIAFAKEYHIPSIFFIGTGILLVSSLLFTVLSTRIRTYETAFNLHEIIRSFGRAPPTDEDFLDQRLVDYAEATKRNRAVNNRVGNLLSASSWFLFGAMFLQLIVFIIALRNSP